MSFLKNRTVVGVICILLSLLICFGLTPLFNQSVSQKAEIVRVDHYGEAVPTRTYDEEHFTANIEVDPSGTFYGWVFKFMGGIQIIAPHECVEEMKRIAHRFL